MTITTTMAHIQCHRNTMTITKTKSGPKTDHDNENGDEVLLVTRNKIMKKKEKKFITKNNDYNNSDN